MNKSETTPTSNAVTKELVVQNKMGIHARPAAMVVRITNKFKSGVRGKDDEQVNGKSIMGLMMLAAAKARMKFIATGDRRGHTTEGRAPYP